MILVVILLLLITVKIQPSLITLNDNSEYDCISKPHSIFGYVNNPNELEEIEMNTKILSDWINLG